MITSEDNAGVPKFNSVKKYEEALTLIISRYCNLEHQNKCLREQILEMKKLMVATEHGVTPESCDNRPECKHCNHSPVCKDELKQNLEGECPYYE